MEKKQNLSRYPLHFRLEGTEERAQEREQDVCTKSNIIYTHSRFRIPPGEISVSGCWTDSGSLVEQKNN